ncbi:MAG: hypothetical protein EOP04_25480 [Proteobacteria bacterium]|nr:MAG: hypothetical protein EOP04_25480 [Pseudomonadota bacterium]
MISTDITEAKKHLDLSDGFPFKGHGSPEEDLRAIDEVIRNKTMPPRGYRVIHQSEQLSHTEIKIIREWVAASLLQLENSNTKADFHVAPE